MLERVRIRPDERTFLALGLLFIFIPLLVEFSGLRIFERMAPGKDILNQSPIGEITRQERTVRKRSESTATFSGLRPGDYIFVGDRILTGKEASARIHLTDGSLLELGPESLIRIEPVRTLGFGGVIRKIKITLERGTVKTAVRPDGAPVLIENARGEVLLEVLPSSPVPAPAARFVETRLSEDVDTTELPATEESPADAVENTSEPDRPLLSRLTLAFSQPSAEIRVMSFPASGPLNDELPISQQKFRIQWKSPGFGRESPYRILIRDSGAGQLILSEKEWVELPVPMIASGEWELKIEVDMRNGKTLRSKPVRFNWSLPAPQPVSPEEGSVFHTGQLQFLANRFLLGWKEMPACPRFRVDVTEDSSPWNPAGGAFETTENFIAIPQPRPGIWKWRVVCLFAPGITSIGPTRRFQLRLGDSP